MLRHNSRNNEGSGPPDGRERKPPSTPSSAPATREAQERLAQLYLSRAPEREAWSWDKLGGKLISEIDECAREHGFAFFHAWNLDEDLIGRSFTPAAYLPLNPSINVIHLDLSVPDRAGALSMEFVVEFDREKAKAEDLVQTAGECAAVRATIETVPGDGEVSGGYVNLKFGKVKEEEVIPLFRSALSALCRQRE